MMALPTPRPCQSLLHHCYQTLCTHWRMWVVCLRLDEGFRLSKQTRWPLFFRLVCPLALHLERLPLSALLMPPTHNPHEMVFSSPNRLISLKDSRQNNVYFLNWIGRKFPCRNGSKWKKIHGNGLEQKKILAKSCFKTA